MVDSRKRMLRLATDLISSRSENPPGGEADVAKVLREHMESNGISCLSIGPSRRPNLVLSTSEGERGRLLLHGHMDTVPVGPRENWSREPFEPVVVDGRLYGRGACDMKGPLAALAETMIRYSRQRHNSPLMMLATSDEESGSSGAEVAAGSGALDGIEFGVCAEPTDLEVLVGERGMLWTRVVARGRAAHGSRPEEGLNAIRLCMDAVRIVTEAEYDYEFTDLMGKPTVSIGIISGGTKVNVVPDLCEASIDMRLVRGQDIEPMLSRMREKIAEAGLDDRVTIEYIHGKPAVVTPLDAEIVEVARQVVGHLAGPTGQPRAATFGTDCSVLQPKVGIVNVICGPGSIGQAHQPDEFIDLGQLCSSVDVYLGIANLIDARVRRR